MPVKKPVMQPNKAENRFKSLLWRNNRAICLHFKDVPFRSESVNFGHLLKIISVVIMRCHVETRRTGAGNLKKPGLPCTVKSA